MFWITNDLVSRNSLGLLLIEISSVSSMSDSSGSSFSDRLFFLEENFVEEVEPPGVAIGEEGTMGKGDEVGNLLKLVFFAG